MLEEAACLKRPGAITNKMERQIMLTLKKVSRKFHYEQNQVHTKSLNQCSLCLPNELNIRYFAFNTVDNIFGLAFLLIKQTFFYRRCIY